jgi:hypothetical protein
MGADMHTGISFALLATVFASTLLASPAQAQRDRVFVASYGSDSNPCTFGSPCKTFQNAVDVVAAGGEVTAIDSAGFGPVIINHAVTITSPAGVEAGIAASAGGNAIFIQAGANDVVVLRGLTLEGAASGAQGIVFISGLRLEINNCAIRNYTYAGIDVGVAAETTILISDTIVSDVTNNQASGILLFASSGGAITAALDHVTVNSNWYGISAAAGEGPVEVTIANSHIDNNIADGITLDGGPSGPANVFMKNVTLNQDYYGILIESYSTVWLSQVTQDTVSGFSSSGGAAINIASLNNAAAYSDGTNLLVGGIMGGSLSQSSQWTPH